MKKLSLLSLFFFASFSNSFALEKNAWNDFEGKIGTSEMRISLFLFDDGAIKGNYLYKRYQTKIEITGHLKGDEIELTETFNEKETGFFKGKVISDDLERLEGDWNNPSGTKRVKFKMTLATICSGSYERRYSDLYGTTVEVEGFVKRVKSAILMNDRRWLSNHVCYPISVVVGKKQLEIVDPKSFSRMFNVIFHPKFKADLPFYYWANLFTDGQVAVFGQGQIWINNKPDDGVTPLDYCIVAIHN